MYHARITSFLRNQYNRSLERKSLYFGVWNISWQARWWLWDCLMCHPKAYWKVSLFRTTTGEKFEIRYINVVRVESSGFWSYIHTHTMRWWWKKSLPYYIFLRSSSPAVGFCIFQFPAELAMHFRIQINFFFRVSFCWNLPFRISWLNLFITDF